MHRTDTPVPRIIVSWPSVDKPRLSWTDVARQMRQRGSALAIVNLRAHALELFKALHESSTSARDPAVFHLTSHMCPQHRKDKLQSIKSRLGRAPCLVVSTQLMEAGVDLDFPLVFRALGPLDSIAQAAGRCNREGALADSSGRLISGEVIVFRPTLGDRGSEVPPGEYQRGTEVTEKLIEQALREGENGPTITDPETFEHYYGALFSRLDLDSKAIQGDPVNSPRNRLDFPEVSTRYRLIDSSTYQVVVRYDREGNPKRSPVATILDRIEREGRMATTELRRLQPYLVNLYQSEFEAARHRQLLVPLVPGWYDWRYGEYDDNLGVIFQPMSLQAV